MQKFFALLLLFSAPAVLAMGEDDPLLAKVSIHQLEYRSVDGENPLVWDAAIWLGKDLRKLWLKTEGETTDGETEHSELRLLYGQALTANWDGMIGVRRDMEPEPERNWLEMGAQGMAPYFIETEVSLFIGESGRSGLRLEAEKELMLTQQWVLSPEIEMAFHGHNDADTETGSGLSSVEAGLRLSYEVVREFAPYIGLNWEKSYGSTADYHSAAGEKTSDTQWVIGIRAWY